MKSKIIITIGRQFGSGGREVGKKLAETLGIAFYDKELLTLAAQESGLSTEAFEKADEQASKGFPYSLPMGIPFPGAFILSSDILSNEKLFELQSNTIRRIAENESCVLVGRCADYILSENPACTNLFIHANEDARIRRISERQQITEVQAKELMVRIDKSRASYYNDYTRKVWGAAASYHLSINTSILGIDGTVAFLKAFTEKRLKRSF